NRVGHGLHHAITIMPHARANGGLAYPSRLPSIADDRPTNNTVLSFIDSSGFVGVDVRRAVMATLPFRMTGHRPRDPQRR
ncbi:hypothetical protein, partial [Burkholderia singularis]|uniref:hypothetical protein n=1 Tax=Burkholderia singularis TaxID=1503053 RepID=UPI001C46DA19